MKSFKYVILCVFSFVITGSVFAQENGTVSGVVIDKGTGETVIGANVQLVADKSIGAATDIDGKYKISLPAGKHELIFSALSLANETRIVTVIAGQETKLNVELSVESKQLGAVVVSAGKFEQKVEDLTVSVEIINPSLVENKGTVNVESALEQTPGVSIVDGEPQIRSGSGYSFGAGSRVMILVDDLPMLSGDAGRPSWGFIPVENLEQIEVIKGASSVLYGSAALNGIINIRTAYPKAEPQTKINLQTGFYDTPQDEYKKWWTGFNPMFGNLNFFHSRKIGQLDLVVGGSGLMDNGYVGPAQVPNPADTSQLIFPKSTTFSNLQNEEGTYEKRWRINSNLRYRSKKHEGLSYGVNFNVMRSKSKGSLLWMDADTNIYRPYQGSDTRTLQTTYNIDPFVTYYGKVNHNRHSLRTRIFHQNNDNDNNQANKNTILFGEYQFQRRVKSINGLTFTAGATGTKTNSVAALYSDTANPEGVNNAASFGAYAQVDKKFWDRLNISIGMRYEYFTINDSGGEGAPVFRSGLSLRVLKATYLRASFGQGFRFPTIAERYINTNVGGLPIFQNPGLQSERSWNAEVGIKQGLKINKFYGYLDVAVFRQEYDNAIEFSFGKWGTSGDFASDLGFRSMNTGGARVTGLDISLLGQGKFTDNFGINLLAGYTFTVPVTLEPHLQYDTTSTNTTPYQDYTSTSIDTTDNILKYRFQHLVKADIEFVVWKFALGGSFKYYSYMQNGDKIFYDLDVNPALASVGLAGVGIVDFRGDEYDPSIGTAGGYIIPDDKPGTLVMDARLSCEISESSKIAFIVNNLGNVEYALRPLSIEAPRSMAIQYTLKF